MTEILHGPRQPDGQSYYQPAGLRRSPPSSSSLFLDNSSPTSSSARSSPNTSTTSIDSANLPLQRTASAPSLHRDSAANVSSCPQIDDSFTASAVRKPSPGSTNGLNIKTDFPRNASTTTSCSEASTDGETPLPSPAYNSDATDTASTTDTTVSESPLPTPIVLDDTMIKDLPNRHVDFLTHDWREEDIWSSWRHIVGNRKIYGERSRLENASWRQWVKTKQNLRTISPESLNWLKESDITWLYGPLKLASSYPISQNVSEPSSRISKNNSFINKKPILKKRSMSEVMLQRSISSSSLLREAATTALFSQRRHPRRSDASSEFSESKLPSEVPSRDQQDYFTSRSNSFCETPSENHEKKHIRFDDVVEQCIALDPQAQGLDDDSDDDQDLHADGNSNSSDDDSGLMMKSKKRFNLRPKPASRSNSHNGRKIIETLPATTLKYRTDSPDITEQAQHHTFGRSWNSSSSASSSRLSPSPSQETIRPTHPSSNFLLPEDSDDSDYDAHNNNTISGEDIDSDSSWSFNAANPKSSLGASSRGRSSNAMSSRTRSHTPKPSNSNNRNNNDDDDDYEFKIDNMRRTGSGMFMPYDDDEPVATGILGRVSETINTARDIAHVIWTVGWRT